MSLILSGTDGLSDVDGSAATPAIRGTDANTGIFFGTDIIGFSEGGVEAMRINASGNLQTIATISVGNATPSTSGAGITFPATQSASSDANTLDDYEEGTFTPTVVYSGTNTPSYSNQLGTYTKIGRVVTVQLYLNWNENGSTGNITFESLPFTSRSGQPRAICSVWSIGLTGLPTNVSLAGYVLGNSTVMTMFLDDNAGTTFSATYTDADQDVYCTVSYIV